MAIKRGDVVVTRMMPDHPGIVKRIAKDGSWADVDWGAWTKRMLAGGLEKPKVVAMPGLSTGGVIAELLQFD